MENENEVVTPEGEPVTTPEPKVEEPVAEETVDELKDRLAREKADAIRKINARALKAEQDKKTLEAKLAQRGDKSLDVEDYIDISASLEGLDQKEKERLAREHKLTGQPLSEIRKDEDFLLWQKAYRDKVAKERSLAPSSEQPEEPKPMSFAEKLRSAKNIQEKEELLKAAGMMKQHRRHPDAGKFPLSR